MNTKANRFLIFFSIVTLLFTISLLSFTKTAREIAQNSFPSVVMLVMEDSNGQPLSLGSGFFVKEGIVTTNLHVIEGASKGYAKIAGKKSKYDIAGIVAIDAKRDLVLLAIKGAKAPSLPLGNSQNVAVGDEVYAIGNPQGLEGTFSQGIISGIREVDPDKLLQITAPISPGSSGGPVLNSKGEVIGVAVATFRGGQNLNFAIPSNYLEHLTRKSQSVTPLVRSKSSTKRKSILEGLGGCSTEGVGGGQLLWDVLGNYSFSLRNKLRENVKNVSCLVIFYDRQAIPIEFDLVQYRGIIPGGLSKRVRSEVDRSVRTLTGGGLDKPSRTRIEFRILDFQITE